jgi:hypothetical protein
MKTNMNKHKPPKNKRKAIILPVISHGPEPRFLSVREANELREYEHCTEENILA